MRHFHSRHHSHSQIDQQTKPAWVSAKFQKALGSLAAFAALIFISATSIHAIPAQAETVTANKAVQEPIAVQLKQFKVTKTEKNEETLADAAVVLPGDVIEYRATYSNLSSKALPVVATLPIPEGTEYIKESAHADNKITYTVAQKDSKYAKEPLLQKVAASGELETLRPVPYASYRFVRWDLGQLSPGTSIEVRARAKVSINQDGDVHAENKLLPLDVAKK